MLPKNGNRFLSNDPLEAEQDAPIARIERNLNRLANQKPKE